MMANKLVILLSCVQANMTAGVDLAMTMPEQDDKGRFLAGNSGNGGRAKGSRNKLGEAFVEALFADFTAHGVEAIARVRAEDPVAYVKVCAGLLPKELKISDERELTDDELTARIRQLYAVLKGEFGMDFDAVDAAVRH